MNYTSYQVEISRNKIILDGAANFTKYVSCVDGVERNRTVSARTKRFSFEFNRRASLYSRVF